MKSDITISRTMTINTGNYNSIKPSVSMTLKDIDVNDVKKVHDDLKTLVDSFLYFEISELLDGGSVIRDLGIEEFAKGIGNFKEDVLKDINKSVRNLISE